LGQGIVVTREIGYDVVTCGGELFGQLPERFRYPGARTIWQNTLATQEAIMRATTLVLLSAVLVPFGVRAQTESQPLDKQVHVQDGGTRVMLESIAVPPMANAPFTLTLQTEWVRSLDGGGTITLVNERRIARDILGRIYEERWMLVPKNGRAKSHMTTIQIADPTNHTLYNCFFDGPHICALTTYSETTSTVYKVDGPPTGPLPNDTGYATREDLGHEFIAGVDTVGTRESVVYNPGVFGNDEKVTVSREYWNAAQLGIDLLSKRSDFQSGTQTFTVTNLDLAEPASQLFELPEGFKVSDRRTTAAVAPN